MNIWLFILIAIIVEFVIYKVISTPKPKRLVVNPTRYELIHHTYIYVDNKVYGAINKRQQIDRAEVEEVLRKIPEEIQWKESNNLIGTQLNTVYHLREIVRKYKVDVDKELIKKVDDCIKLADYSHICILFEVRAILQEQFVSEIRN